MSWTVQYELQSPIPVTSRVDRYPMLGLQLTFDNEPRLLSLLHTVDAPDTADAADAVHESTRALSLFLQVLEMGYGLPVVTRVVRASPSVAPAGRAARHFSTTTATVGAAIATTVSLPSEAGLCNANPRMTALLYMFNAARPPVSDEEALRLLYIILEVLNGSPRHSTWTATDRAVKYVRDFVSHGVVLENKNAVAYIEGKTGSPIKMFDPQDPIHRAFVAGERFRSHELVQQRLAVLLSPRTKRSDA